MLSEYPEAKKYQSFDPRPVESRSTSQDEVNHFLVSLQNLNYESNWEAVPIHYEDYEITNKKYDFFYEGCGFNRQEISRKSALKIQVNNFISNLNSEFSKFEEDALTNDYGYHIAGTDNSME